MRLVSHFARTGLNLLIFFEGEGTGVVCNTKNSWIRGNIQNEGGGEMLKKRTEWQFTIQILEDINITFIFSLLCPKSLKSVSFLKTN